MAGGETAARGWGGDSSIHPADAEKKGKPAAAARLGGGATHAHVLRTRHRSSLLRRRPGPLSNLMTSFAWWNSFTWWNGFGWPSFVENSHGGASPWAEAAGGASRQRTMRAWHGAALGRIFGVEGHAQALRVSDSVLGTTRSPRVRLALRLHGARGAQAGVAHWAGATVRDRGS